jgi:hypothetical protein
MAYLTCPWCLTPQQVADESIEYRCFSCAGEIGFFTCPHCDLSQTVHKRWAAFTCSNCDRKVDLPRRWSYAVGARAVRVKAAGFPYPKI